MSRNLVMGLVSFALALPALAAPQGGSSSGGGRELRYLLPNLPETPGLVETSARAIDSRIHVTYGGGLPETSGGRAPAVVVTDGSLYLYGEDSKPLSSATGQDVCNPCAFSVSSVERKRTLSIEDLIVGAGGFSTTGMPAFAVVVLNGSDLEQVAVMLQVQASGDTPQAASSCGGGSVRGHTGHVTLLK